MAEITTNPESSPQPSPEPPVHDLQWIFIGKNGIRAGWGILIFTFIFFAAIFAADILFPNFLRSFNPSATLSPMTGLKLEGIQCSWVLIATAVLALIERKSLFAYGYQGTARAVRFLSGLVCGFIAISVLVLVLWKFGLLAFDGQRLHGAALWKYAAKWGLVFLGTGLFEESTMRGYLQFTATRGLGFWWGALVISFLFGFGHGTNPGETPVGLFSVAAAGLIWCLSLWYTGSLWWALGYHAAWDWGESYFYGTRDSGVIAQGHLFGTHPVGKVLWSGGATGPEGSLLIIPLILLIAFFMWLWWGRHTQSPFAGSAWRPTWSRRPRIEPINLESGSVEATS